MIDRVMQEKHTQTWVLEDGREFTAEFKEFFNWCENYYDITTGLNNAQIWHVSWSPQQIVNKDKVAKIGILFEDGSHMWAYPKKENIEEYIKKKGLKSDKCHYSPKELLSIWSCFSESNMNIAHSWSYEDKKRIIDLYAEIVEKNK